MQNVGQSESRNVDKVNVQVDGVKSSSSQSSPPSPSECGASTTCAVPADYMTDSSESEDDSVSEAEMDEEVSSKYLHVDPDRVVDPEMQARLEALLEAAGISKLAGDGQQLANPDVLRRLTSSVSCALDEAAAALTRMRNDQPPQPSQPSLPQHPPLPQQTHPPLPQHPPLPLHPPLPPHTPHVQHAPHAHKHHQDKPTQCGTQTVPVPPPGMAPPGLLPPGMPPPGLLPPGIPPPGLSAPPALGEITSSLVEACSDGDVGTVRKLLTEGRSVHETTEEGESLLSLACSAGYYELAQVLLAMHASVEDRGIKGDCTPLMEASSAGHTDIVRLLIAHGAEVNAVSGSGNTPLMYACAGGHQGCVQALLENGANVEDHNENGHTPLMEAASAGHVGVAKILLEHGAGINTHSNEFKESALTLACYKGHLDMVRFLLAAGADREHKTDEMHTALMEASMDGHVEVARLLLDSGAQVNMPTDSFESPLTLAACGGHVELAMLLLERGANIEEVNDEGYTPLMEAAREGHEEMVALLLGQGAAINAQTDETQETALTLACCGGFLEVADFLIKAGADPERGASTPLMEAAQEGHLELVRYLLDAGAKVHAHTGTGDAALTYACENGHTDVADLLLRYGADLEHESEGGRTPLMKACRAGHLCTVQFLAGKGADVNRVTAGGEHTPLSLACAGGHADVVKFLLACDADPFRKLKDNSTTLIEAAKGGHTAVVQLLLDYPRSVMMEREATVAAILAPPPPPPPLPTDEAPGLSPTQAAHLGLRHVPAPGGQHPRTLVPQPPSPPPPPPAHPPPSSAPALAAAMSQICLDACKKQTPIPPGGYTDADGAAAAAACSAAVVAVLTGNQGMKHKCLRKQRGSHPQADHHLPPPPDIVDEQQRVDALAAQQYNESLPEAEALRSSDFSLHENDARLMELAELRIPGVATPGRCTTPAQMAFTQCSIQDRPRAKVSRKFAKFSCKYILLESLQRLVQHITEVGRVSVITQQQLAELHETFALNKPPPGLEPHLYENYTTQDECVRMGAGETRKLTAVLAYLQREVPSMVALPPNELRSLVLQVMQQKSNEMLGKSEEGIDESADGCALDRLMEGEVETRRMLAAAEEALAAEWPRIAPGAPLPSHLAPPLPPPDGAVGCQYRMRPPSPAPGAEANILARACTPDRLHRTRFTLPSPMHSYDEVYRFTPPHVPLPQTAPPPQHVKREPPTNNAAKKKARLNGARSRGAGAGQSASYPAPHPQPPQPAPAAYSAMDVDGETDSNHDTALTLACAGGHDELVELLLSRGADIEHRDKKGFTPLILAATAGHEKIVEILLNNGADIEAQSERTKDTPLSLACSGGRYEVVELILSRGANKEHRNVSDYTPLSLAASGGYVNIIRLLLHHQAEINSRTGSKLGISPLMLAAMNGHTAAVKVLLDCGSDINAQIETNRNTALTLACFQGRHEVVSLLLDRKANVEHRAKTGLTPLMEAASGGYVEVGRVLLDKGADVNAPPVPSSRDTALTIAADKGHTKFVELLLKRRAAVEVKNKKGNSPLWLAANGGHLAVVEMLYIAGADIDSQDNRKVSCLMAAFRKGHKNVVKWMVSVVTQFPSDQEMTRYICTISDKELLEKCQECVRMIRAAKETQAARAYQNAAILLEELDAERSREESRKQAAARRRERKKKKKMEKKEEQRKLVEENSEKEEGGGDGESDGGEPEEEVVTVGKEEGDSGIDANSQGSCSSSDVKAPPPPPVKSKRKKKDTPITPPPAQTPAAPSKRQPDKAKAKIETKPEKETKPDKKQEKENVAPSELPTTPVKREPVQPPAERRQQEKKHEEDITKNITVQNVCKYGANPRKTQVFESTRYNVDKDDVDTYDKNKKCHTQYQWEDGKSTSPKSANVTGRREEGWKEVVRKSSVQTLSTVEPGCKKVSVGSHAISRVIGRAGTNINAIRSATGAHIEVDKQTKGQGERIITIKGSAEATKQAATLIAAMIRDPDADIAQLLPRVKLPTPAPQPLQAKTPKQTLIKSSTASPSVTTSAARVATTPRAAAKLHAATVRAPPPRLQPQVEKRGATCTPTGTMSTPPKPTLSYTGAIVGARSNTFAAKLSALPASDVKAKPIGTQMGTTPSTVKSLSRDSPPLPSGPPPPTPPAHPTHKSDDEPATLQRPPSHLQLSPEGGSWNTEETPTSHSTALHINTTQQSGGAASVGSGGGSGGVSAEYSLFRDASGGAGVWGQTDHHHNPEPPPPQVDASKAPGYRGGAGAGGCSPCSRTSSHGSTPPPTYHDHAPPRHAPQPIHQPIGNPVNNIDMAALSRNGPIYQDNPRNGHNMMQVSMGTGVGNVGSVGMSGAALGLGYVESVSRLNPRAPDFSSRPHLMHPHHNQLFGAGGAATNAGNLSNLLMSYQQPNVHKHAPPQPPHPYHSLLERGVGGVSNVGGVGGWGEEEERKPRPIGTERAWKLTSTDDWGHMQQQQQHDNDRYQGMGAMGVGLESPYGAGVSGVPGGAGPANTSGATQAALSLLHAMPLQYMPPPAAHEHHWDHHHLPANEKQQGWSKWTH